MMHCEDVIVTEVWEGEVLHCNRCGHGFSGCLRFETPPPKGAPTGICHPCQDEIRR